MTGYAYSAFVVAGAVALKGVASALWGRFKEREATKALPMRQNRKGVYVPWGRVQKIERAGNVWLVIWVAMLVFTIGFLIYVKTTGHDPLAY